MSPLLHASLQPTSEAHVRQRKTHALSSSLIRPAVARLLIAAAFSAAASVACSKEPTRWDKAVETAKSVEKADLPKPVVAEGGSLNKFFPPKEFDGKKVTFTAEKPGAVEAKLEEGGAEIGTLAITDTNGNADALAKFDKAAEEVSGAPLVTQGKNKSAALVGKRFQVSVMSQKLDPEARKAILGKFDIRGLSSFTPPVAK